MSSTWREQEGRTPFKQDETSRARFEERQPSNCDQLENKGKEKRRKKGELSEIKGKT